MKILKIEFQNINSLKGTHLIDFTASPFTASSLFAITGPTGSGKSTILDVISLALFNQVPRLGKITKNEILSKGAILTKNQTEAFARVTYECKNGNYTSTWSISTARTGSLRDYEMEIAECSSGNILDLKKSDVPAKNENLIGLNYNQFIKSVLLAQGEFAQFLRAKKDERGELLEKITGTGIYRQLGRLAFEKNRQENLEIKKQQDAIAIIEEELLPEEKRLDLTVELENSEKLCKPLEEEIKNLGKSIELKTTLAKQLQEIDRITAEKEKADVSLKSYIETYGVSLEQHEKIRDVADELRNWGRLAKECAGYETDLGKITKRQETNFDDLEKCLKEVSGFTRLEVTRESVENRLEEFSKKVTGIDEELKEKIHQYKSLERELQTQTRDLPCDLQGKEPAAIIQELKDLKNTSEEKRGELKSKLKDIDLKNPAGEKFRLKKQLVETREAMELAAQIESTLLEMDRLTREEEKLIPLIKDLPKEIRHNEDQVSIYREKLQNITLQKQNQLLQANLEEHRAALKEGEPCPLCGSSHHPFAEQGPKKDSTLDDKMHSIEQELNKWNISLTGNRTTLQHHQRQLFQYKEEKDNKTNRLKKEQDELSSKYGHLKKENDKDWKSMCANIDNILEGLDTYQTWQQRIDCIETSLPLLEEMVELKNSGKELREKLANIYPGKDINRDSRLLQTRWTQIIGLKKAIQEQLEELYSKMKKAGDELTTLENELTAHVTEKGFENIATAGDALLPDREYFKLREGKDKIENEIVKTAQTIKLLTSQLERSKETDVPQTKAELSIQLQEKNTEFETIQNNCRHLHRILLNDKENLEKLKNIRVKIADKEKKIRRWKLLNELIGDSTGKKFNDFAQDLSLGKLLQLANIRLKDLSDRYSIAKPEEDEDDGLVAIDEHMGGQRRSVKTLSGGETFILSLSMALALSDLASKNVEINSLFIDEGFGTLDPETLDQTLDTLEKLQAESSKTIGIISHVESLKERIATQIQLTRNGQGYSSLQVRS